MAVPAGMIIAAAVLAVQVYSEAVGGFSASANRTASVLTLSLVALTVLAAVSRPLSTLRLAILAAMCLGVVLLMMVPLLQEFFLLEWPPPELSVAAFTAAAVAMLAVLALGRVHTERNAGDQPGRPRRPK